MAEFSTSIRDGYCLVRDGHIINEETIDDFESGTLIGRYILYSNAHRNEVTTAAAYSGTYGLEQWDGTEIWSLPEHTDDLNYYPRDGDTIEFYISPQVTAATQYWFILCPQHPDSTADRYQVEALTADGGFRIRKDSGGSRSILDTGFVSWSAGQTYRIRVRIRRNPSAENPEGIEAQVRRVRSGGDLTTPIENLYTSDTTWIEQENGVGFRSAPGGSVYWDEVRTTHEGIVYG